MIPKHWHLIAFLFILLSCRTTKIAVGPEDSLKQKIIGSWSEKHETAYSIANFEKDSVYYGTAWRTTARQQELLSMSGKWWIKDRKLYNVVDEVSDPEYNWLINMIHIDTIVNITNDSLNLIDDKGKPYSKIRVLLMK